jgi:hypothetical protein
MVDMVYRNIISKCIFYLKHEYIEKIDIETQMYIE